MDVARPPRKKTTRNVSIGIGVIAVAGLAYWLANLKQAAPTVDMAVVIQDSVRQGDMTREVRGNGTLVPEQIQIITAGVTGRVDRLVVQSGEMVKPGDVLLEMSSPDAAISTMTADQNLNQAQANLLQLRTTLRSAELAQRGTVATTHTALVSAEQDSHAADTLLKQKLIAPFDATNKRALADEMAQRYAFEKERLDDMVKSTPEQISAAESNIKQLEGIADFYHKKQQSLVVRSPVAGVAQGLTLQQGQYMQEGSLLLKVVQPGRLKAVLQINESQAKDVVARSAGEHRHPKQRFDPGTCLTQGPFGDRRDGAGLTLAPRRPAARAGCGARPELSMGRIQIEVIKIVLYTGRPGYGGATGPVGLFKIVDNGHAAVRVQVLLGATSVTAVEIKKGLSKGDKVILSDMNQYDGVDRVRLKQ